MAQKNARRWIRRALVRAAPMPDSQKKIQPAVNLMSGLSTSPKRISPKKYPRRVAVYIPPTKAMPTSVLEPAPS